MTTFAVTDQSQLIEATNYLLSNLGQSTGNGGGNVGNAVTINTQTGVIGQGGVVIGYYYQWLNIAYANSSDGGSGFSTSRFNGALYYGVYNNAANPAPNLTNPANYQWQAITGGLGTTKNVYYSTLGGRQISFIIATANPGTGYVQVSNGVPIDLDFVTSTTTLPIVIATAYYNAANANIAPSTPTGGTYDFGNLVFTPPAGWANSIPANNVAFFSSQNTFEATGNGIGTVGPSFPWTTPVLTGKLGQDGTNGTNGANGTNGLNGVSTYFYNVFLSANVAPPTPTGGFYNFGTGVGTPPAGWSNQATSPLGDPIWAVSATVSSNVPTANISIGNSWSPTFQYTGAGGAPGQRGFIPMAYVLTPTNPTLANSATLSQWFNANTSGTPPGSNTAPVGTGYPPVGGDTAAFTWTGNTSVAPVYTYDSSTSTWSPAAGQVINGNVFVTGSVNSSKLNANDIYTIKLQSTNANFGNNSSNGFWFDSTSGNARIAGNVSIGNNLTIGNNATIGNSLTIGGVLLNGALVANVVTAGTIAPAAVTPGTIAAGAVQANAITANTMSGNIIVANTMAGNVIIANTLNGNAIIANTIAANTINANAISAGTLNTGVLYAGNITSFGATQGDNNSPGYWLNYASGNARFGGNVSIGANLNVQGLITTGSLQANTVATTTIVPQTISGGSSGISGPSDSPFVITGPLTANTVYITDQYVTINTTQNNQAVYVWGGVQIFDVVATMSGVSQIQVNLALVRQNPGGGLVVLAEFNGLMTNTSGVSGTYSQRFSNANFPGYTDIAPTAGTGYIYGIIFLYGLNAGTVTPQSVTFYDRNALAQTLKR